MNDKEIFIAAKKIIDHEYSFVGIVEDFNASIKRLAQIFIIQNQLTEKHTNFNYRPQKHNIPRGVIYQIASMNRADQLLYNHIYNKFTKMLP